MSVAELYAASPIKRQRATKTAVHQRRSSLYDIVDAMTEVIAGPCAAAFEREMLRQHELERNST